MQRHVHFLHPSSEGKGLVKRANGANAVACYPFRQWERRNQMKTTFSWPSRPSYAVTPWARAISALVPSSCRSKNRPFPKLRDMTSEPLLLVIFAR